MLRHTGALPFLLQRPVYQCAQSGDQGRGHLGAGQRQGAVCEETRDPRRRHEEGCVSRGNVVGLTIVTPHGPRRGSSVERGRGLDQGKSRDEIGSITFSEYGNPRRSTIVGGDSEKP